MTYRDKSTNRNVVLTPSQTEYLAVERSEGEGLKSTRDQRVFDVRYSNNADGILVLRARNDQESLVEITRALDQLRQDPAIVTITPAFKDETGATRYAWPGRVVVKVKGSGARRRQIIQQAHGSIVREFGASGLLDVEVPENVSTEDFIDRLNAVREVVFAEPTFYGVDDQELTIRITVGRGRDDREDVPPELPWNLTAIDIVGAWTSTRGDADVVVAIVDGAPEVDHEAIAARFFGPLGDSQFFASYRAVSSHATNIAGVVAGQSAQISGAAPDVRLLPFVVNLASQVYAERAEALAAVAQIARDRTWNGQAFSRVVLSCSWRTSGDVAAIRTALEDVIAAGVIPIFSAGNDATTAAHYPSDYSIRPGPLGEAVVSVAATDRNDCKASYSNYSSGVTMCAPGGDGLPLDARDILCADQGGTYGFAAGTSIAVPHVAAVAALMLAVNPDLDAATIKRLLRESCDDISALNIAFSTGLGSGRLNARRAVQAAAAYVPRPGSPVYTPGPQPTPPSPAPGAPPPATPAPAGSGPIVRVEPTVAPGVANRIRDRLSLARQDIATQTGWSITTATLSDGRQDITLELPRTR